MIIYFNSNGDISSLKPERVYQGSNEVDQFLIVAPFNTASTVELTFTLPNGQVLPPYILSGGAIFTNELNIWSFLLKSDITRFAGQIRFGVRVLGVNGKVLATGSDTFVVERGTAPTLPPEPTPDVYEQILELLGGLSVDKVDRVDVSDPDYIVGYVYSKDGIKTPNAFYYNFSVDSVIGYNNQTLNNIKGALFVLDAPTQLRQIEYLFADDLKSKPKIFTRQVYYDGNKEVTIVTPFVEIGWDIYGDLNNKVTDVLSQLGGKQDKTDNSLQTNSKQVVGAINENKTNIENNYNMLNNNKLDKNFNLLVERTYAQLADFVAVRSGDQTLKMTLQTLRTYLTQGLVGLSFQIMELLPLTGVGNIFYLIPMVDTIEHFTDFADFPSVGEEKKLYIADDEHTGGATGWYNWDIDTETYVSYNLGYYEYIWLEEISKFELIGSTQVDLTGYATETWVTNNFIAKTILNGGTTGQILAKKSDADLDFEYVDLDGTSLDGVEMIIDPDKTYLVIKTFDEFTLLTGSTGSPNYIIEWGDGSSENIVDTSNPTHTYEKAGMYLITISGSFTNGIVVGGSSNVNKDKMIEVYGGTNYPTSISSDAFRYCTKLTTANFLRVTSIGDYAFQNCTLTTVNFPNVTSIGIYAFYGCASLTTVSFPKSTSVGDSAFYNCYGLTTANFPSVTSIGDSAFRGCTLRTASFPRVTSIGNRAFYSWSSLKNLTLGNVTTASAYNAFQYVKLDTLTISGTITDTDIARIKNLIISSGGSFSQSCEIKHGLQVEKTPTLDNDVVRKIDLDTLIIPTPDANNVSYDNSVSGLVATNVQDAIDEISVTEGGSYVPNILKDPAKTYLVVRIPTDNDTFTLLTGTTGSPNYTIEWGDGFSDSITDTSNPTHTYSKAGMYLITISGAFENGIVYGSSANVNKNKIIELYGGNNYPTSISSNAFIGCSNLTTAYFSNVTSISSEEVFGGCTSLITANFPLAISIGGSAFYGCTSLTTANFPLATSVSTYAFYNCKNLTTVNFPSVTTISNNAFQSCSSLTTANVPSATSIGVSAFNGCTNLTTAYFPLAISMGLNAFVNCSNLTTAYLPLVTIVEGLAFSGCTRLTTAYFQSATSITDGAFYNCTSLKELTIGNVTTTASGTRFENVKLVNLTIAQDVINTDIDRIKQFYGDNGGTFTGTQINSL